MTDAVISGSHLLAQVTLDEIAAIADENQSFRGYFQGYIAEPKLKQQLLAIDGVRSVVKIPDRAPMKGDFLVQYNDEFFTIESKCLSTRRIKHFPDGSATGTVCLKKSDSQILPDGRKTTCLLKGGFHILAVCMFALTGTWEFQFIANKYLEASPKYPDRLSTSVKVDVRNNPRFTPNVVEVFADI